MSDEFRGIMTEDSELVISVRLQTSLGPAEIQWRDDLVVRFLWLPKRTKAKQQGASKRPSVKLTSAQQELAQDLIDYAVGTQIDFSQVPVDLSAGTDFQRRIWKACQKIPYGEVVTYGELARLAGRAGAARAVGTAMSKNRIPLIIPCHRVVAACNQIGGFTSAEGVSQKKRLLDLEAGDRCNLKVPSSAYRRKMRK
ncbi:methylated-DNA--[protein]-cysteine S-methyltransferase [Bremerella cremea]